MIIVKLLGGLGNQMFQYACGRRLAHIHNTRLVLDSSGYAHHPFRTYDLHCFALEAEIAACPDARNMLHIRERSMNFDAAILKLPDNIFLCHGYWQSERYFSDARDVIRQDFSLDLKPNDENASMAEKIANSQAISIHVRRGDYITDPVANLCLGVLECDYYRNSLEYLAQHTGTPTLFVFSDDQDWVKENLRFDYETHYIDINDDANSYEDLRLMSLCQHHVIANSAFSWWGAWLGLNPGKKVCVPARWFRMNKRATADIVPDHWTKIDNTFQRPVFGGLDRLRAAYYAWRHF